MHYELWDTVSRNLLDDFATEAEALTAIGELLAINDPNMVNGLTLLRVGGREQGAMVASGTELATRARIAASARGRLPA